MSDKISIRFYGDRPVRALWDDENSKWWFSVLDIIAIFNAEDDYSKTRNYWKYLKTKLKTESSQLVSVTNQLKLKAPDGKMRLTDVLDAVTALTSCFLSSKSIPIRQLIQFVSLAPLALLVPSLPPEASED